MAKRIVVLIDGAFLRVKAAKAGKKYDPTFIEAFALGCKTSDEEILRVLYYDCVPYSGTVRLPVSGAPFVFAGSDKWLEELACKDLFAVRLGVLKFLDIASYCENRHADRVVLVSNDTDCVPAIKYGRKSGMQVVVAELPNCEIARELLMHSDFKRSVPWPSHLT